jgi:hypothetical protein
LSQGLFSAITLSCLVLKHFEEFIGRAGAAVKTPDDAHNNGRRNKQSQAYCINAAERTWEQPQHRGRRHHDGCQQCGPKTAHGRSDHYRRVEESKRVLGSQHRIQAKPESYRQNSDEQRATIAQRPALMPGIKLDRICRLIPHQWQCPLREGPGQWRYTHKNQASVKIDDNRAACLEKPQNRLGNTRILVSAQNLVSGTPLSYGVISRPIAAQRNMRFVSSPSDCIRAVEEMAGRTPTPVGMPAFAPQARVDRGDRLDCWDGRVPI